jgi:hypothetical protein
MSAMGEQENKEQVSTAEKSGKTSKEWRDWLDVAAKLIGAVAVAAITLIVHGYESKMSLTTLQSQREQAESNLRAAMLHDLVEPIIGRPAQGEDIDPDRERLLVELLTLNFHNHFEFKPLLLEVDGRLAAKGRQAGRESLESVARRVSDRQINRLGAIAATEPGKSASGPVFEPISLFFQQTSEVIKTETPCSTDPVMGKQQQTAAPFVGGLMSQPVCIASPDGSYDLTVSVLGADFKKKTADLSITVTRGGQQNILRAIDFTVTPFDFPLTDNNELDPDHRFAVILYHLDTDHRIVQLRVVWFPPGYIPERERPVDYRAVRSLLGVGGK